MQKVFKLLNDVNLHVQLYFVTIYRTTTRLPLHDWNILVKWKNIFKVHVKSLLYIQLMKKEHKRNELKMQWEKLFLKCKACREESVWGLVEKMTG